LRLCVKFFNTKTKEGTIMEFYDVLKNRRSVRSYKADPIPQKSLDKIAEAVQAAPSACNKQPWNFRIVLNEELKAKICKCYQADWLKEAPAIIVALGNSEECWKRLDGTPITDIDMGIAMEHVVLAASAEGLSTCWICAYEITAINKALNIMKPWSVLAISPLGFSEATPEMPKRKPIEEVFQIIE
jgi:nitroreductase